MKLDIKNEAGCKFSYFMQTSFMILVANYLLGPRFNWSTVELREGFRLYRHR